MRPIKKILFVILTGVILIVVLLCLLEIGLRIFWSGRPPVPENPPPFPYCADADLDYVLKHNHIYQPGNIMTDEYGFRRSRWTVNNDGKEFTVVALGDSVMFGVSTYDSWTITDIMERRFRPLKLKEYEGVRVINLGMPGYDISQYFRALQKHGLRYNPDLVVVGITVFNDFEGLETRYLGNGHLYQEPVSGINGYNIDFALPPGLIKSLYLYRYLYFKWLAPGRRMIINEKLTVSEEIPGRLLVASCDSSDRLWEDIRDTASRFKKISDERKIPVLFLIFPAASQVYYSDMTRAPQEILLKILDEFSLRYIDLYESFVSFYRTSGYLPFRDKISHPADVMYDRIASEVRDRAYQNIMPRTAVEFNGTIDLGDSGDIKNLSFGWGDRERFAGRGFRWMQSDCARLVFNDFTGEISSVTISCFPLAECSPQEIAISLNGEHSGSLLINKVGAFSSYRLKLGTPVKLKKFNTLDIAARCAKKIEGTDKLLLKTSRVLSVAVDKIIIE